MVVIDMIEGPDGVWEPAPTREEYLRILQETLAKKVGEEFGEELSEMFREQWKQDADLFRREMLHLYRPPTRSAWDVLNVN